MRIANVDENIIRQLKNSGILDEMRSLESCEWVILEEIDEIIVGAAGVGGVFHVSGIQINEKFRGKGIGKKLQNELINESNRIGYSFITVFNDPRNTTSAVLHDSLGYKKNFRIHYSKGIVNDVKGISFNKKGKFVLCFLKIFNTKIGTALLACSLKILKASFPRLIIHNESDLPSPDIKWIINNFEKIKC